MEEESEDRADGGDAPPSAGRWRSFSEGRANKLEELRNNNACMDEEEEGTAGGNVEAAWFTAGRRSNYVEGLLSSLEKLKKGQISYADGRAMHPGRPEEGILTKTNATEAETPAEGSSSATLHIGEHAKGWEKAVSGKGIGNITKEGDKGQSSGSNIRMEKHWGDEPEDLGRAAVSSPSLVSQGAAPVGPMKAVEANRSSSWKQDKARRAAGDDKEHKDSFKDAVLKEGAGGFYSIPSACCTEGGTAGRDAIMLLFKDTQNGEKDNAEMHQEGRGGTKAEVELAFEEVVNATDNMLKKGVIGYIYGPRPPAKLLLDWCDRNWGSFGCWVARVRPLGRGFYCFLFDNEEAARKVCVRGSWVFRGNAVSVFPWSQDFDAFNPKPMKIPVWVEFPGLPLNLCPFVNRIAGSIGEVVALEGDDKFNPRINPQACVSVDMGKELPDSIDIKTSGRVLNQAVFYRNLPDACFKCGQRGHYIRNCPALLEKNSGSPALGGDPARVASEAGPEAGKDKDLGWQKPSKGHAAGLGGPGKNQVQSVEKGRSGNVTDNRFGILGNDEDFPALVGKGKEKEGLSELKEQVDRMDSESLELEELDGKWERGGEETGQAKMDLSSEGRIRKERSITGSGSKETNSPTGKQQKKRR